MPGKKKKKDKEKKKKDEKSNNVAKAEVPKQRRPEVTSESFTPRQVKLILAANDDFYDALEWITIKINNPLVTFISNLCLSTLTELVKVADYLEHLEQPQSG